MTNLDSIFKSRDITLPTKVRLVKAMVFPVVTLQMWELDCEESWALKNWCFWTVVLEKTLESPLDCKIQPVHSEGDHSGCSLEGLMLKLKLQYFGHLMRKSWLTGKDPHAGRDWGQEEKGMTEDEMAGWHHWFDGCEFEWTPGVGDGQGGLACCDSWGHEESDTTERLSNWTELTDRDLRILTQKWTPTGYMAKWFYYPCRQKSVIVISDNDFQNWVIWVNIFVLM